MGTRSEAQKARWDHWREQQKVRGKAEIALLRDIPDSLTEAIRLRDLRIHELEEEVKQLKRQLAAKAAKTPAEHAPIGKGDLSHLPHQDQEWLERRLGIKR